MRDQLLLASDQFNALERKATELAFRVVELEAELQTVRTRLSEALADKLRVAAEKGSAAERPELEPRILVLLAAHGGLTVPTIAHQLQVHAERVRFHVDELFNAKFIYGAHFMGRESEWYVDQAGRRYLIEHDLLS